MWKSVHRIKPSLLPSLLDPLLAHRFHPPSLKKALGIVLDKLGKPSYDSPYSFRVIVLLRTLSNILERVVASCLLAQAAICSLIHPLQCGSLPGRSTADAALVLQQNVESFHRLQYKVSTLFFNVKGGFDNVESPSLLSLLRRKGVSPYLVQWVGSFLRDRTCRLTFQGSPRLFAPVSVGVPQGSPTSPLLFVIDVSSLHLQMPRSLIISYLDDLAVTVASPSYRTNIRLLQKSFSRLKRKASPINISFSIPKTELIHWRTARSNEPPCSLPVQLEDQLFYPQSRLKWLGFIFTPAFNPRSHFSRRYTLANTALATIRRLSPPGMDLPPYLCLSLARSLLAPILLYGSAIWTPPLSIMGPMSVFWHRVCWWITNCFSSTNLTCLHREACLPPLPTLVRPQRRLAGQRLTCSPPEVNPATARLPKSVPTFSPHLAPLMARGKITPKPYLFCNLDWRSAPNKTKNPRYRHNAITALANAAAPLVHDISTLPPISLHLTDYLPPTPGVIPSYARLKLTAKQLLFSDWSATPAPRTIPIRPRRVPIPSWAWASWLHGGYTRCALGKATLRLTPRGTILRPTRLAHCARRPCRPSNMPSCPAPPLPVRDSVSSKGSRTWPLRPQSGPTSSCSLRWLSSSAPPPLVSLRECPLFPTPSTDPLRIPSLYLPPYPPLALETSYAVYTFLDFSYGCCATFIRRVGGFGYVCFFC